MFQANENLALRQHKRRITKYIEECIPSEALDAGTSVMVMEVKCKIPGCVPIETAVVICFPHLRTIVREKIQPDGLDSDVKEEGEKEVNDTTYEFIPGLKESRSGGNFKTKILMPMVQVTKDDVLDSLPSAFLGGRRTIEKMSMRVRDIMISQITQITEEGDQEEKRLIAQYLITSLETYIENGCTPFADPPVIKDETLEEEEVSGPFSIVSTPLPNRFAAMALKQSKK